MKGRSHNLHRLKDPINYKEDVFLKIWRKNYNNSVPTLMYLLGEGNTPSYDISDRDKEVAETVIQWLGSNCGQYFLKEVEEKIKQIEKEKRKKNDLLTCIK
jgi:hypothetical protein